MKNKKLFLKIYILFVIIISVSLIILQILGSKNRTGYLTDFKLNTERTLQLNNLTNITENFTVDDELDEESLSNYLLTNESITNFVHHFRIRYYDKVFRNSDIYGVYVDLSNLPDYIANVEMDEGGSPYGNFISDKKSIEIEKVDNVNYILKVKIKILFLLFFIFGLILTIFLKTKKLYVYIFTTVYLFSFINIINYLNLNLYNFIIYFIISLIFSLFFFIFYLFAEKKNIKIENVFLVSFIFIGILYFILLPYLQVPDEGAHFYRALEISSGYFISDKNNNIYPYSDIMGKIPSSYTEVFSNINKNMLLDKDMLPSIHSGASLYSFISYIPQSLGIIFGKLFTSNVYLLAYFGRLFNFIFSILVFYLSIKYVSIKKMSLYFIAFLPMTLQEAISLAPDTIVTSCSILLISLCLNIKYREEDKIITYKEIILIYLLMVFIAGSKIVYLPICFIVLIIPKSKLKNSKYIFIPVILLCIFINIVWLYISSQYLHETIRAKEQLNFILNNPFNYLYIFITTIYKNFHSYISGIIGRDLSWFSIHIPDIAYYIFLFSLILLLLFDNDSKYKEVDARTKLYIFFIISSIIGLIFTALYIQWTYLKNNEILGVQGRYFMPILFYIFILFSNNKLKINFESIRINIFIFISMINLLVLSKIFSTLSKIG